MLAQFLERGIAEWFPSCDAESSDSSSRSGKTLQPDRPVKDDGWKPLQSFGVHQRKRKRGMATSYGQTGQGLGLGARRRHQFQPCWSICKRQGKCACGWPGI